MDRPAGSTRPGVIRADPAQTAMLRNALAETSNPSADQLAALGEKTNLPEKWIHNWFSRQRVKANKMGGARNRGAHDRLHVKQETMEGLDVSAAASSPAATSFSDTTALFASSSSATVDMLQQPASISAQGNARKGKTKTRNVSREPAQKMTSPPRVLRSRKRKDIEVPSSKVQGPSGRRVKAEDVEAAALRYTPVDDAATALEPGTNLAPGTWPAAPPTSSAPPTYKLPSVAPPQRSPMTAVQPRPKVRTTPRSGLAKKHGQLQVALSTASGGTGVAQTTRTKLKGARRAPAAASGRRNAPHAHTHGPVFHSQFQNNVPADYDYENNAPPPPSSSSSAYRYYGGEVYPHDGEDGYQGSGEPPANGARAPGFFTQQVESVGSGGYADGTVYNHQFGIRPLAPAFDWENHAPATGTVLAEPVVLENEGQENYYAFGNEFTYPEQDTYPPQYYEHNETANIHSPGGVGLFEPLPTPMDLYAPYSDILDPLKAPLKHLTDVLHAFRDESGSYTRLLAPEERGSMMLCLLDDGLMPFEAAMGLALLERLDVL